MNIIGYLTALAFILFFIDGLIAVSWLEWLCVFSFSDALATGHLLYRFIKYWRAPNQEGREGILGGLLIVLITLAVIDSIGIILIWSIYDAFNVDKYGVKKEDATKF